MLQNNAVVYPPQEVVRAFCSPPRPGNGIIGPGPGGGGPPTSMAIGTAPIDTHTGTAAPDQAPYRRSSESVPHITPGTLEIHGGLSRETIRRVIQSHRRPLRYCYNRGLIGSPNLSGKLRVQFLVGGQGYVTQSEIITDTLHDSRVRSCLLAKIRKWKFPAPRGEGTVEVRYPFVFSRSLD